MSTFSFFCIDNGQKRQGFSVKANSKSEAEKKAFAKAKKNAKGDIIFLECRLSIA